MTRKSMPAALPQGGRIPSQECPSRKVPLSGEEMPLLETPLLHRSPLRQGKVPSQENSPHRKRKAPLGQQCPSRKENAGEGNTTGQLIEPRGGKETPNSLSQTGNNPHHRPKAREPTTIPSKQVSCIVFQSFLHFFSFVGRHVCFFFFFFFV